MTKKRFEVDLFYNIWYNYILVLFCKEIFMEITRFHWMCWIGTMLRRLRSSNLEGAANVLACCLPDPEIPETASDAWGAQRLFGHPELIGRHQPIWDSMMSDKLITPEHIPAVKVFLQRYGWQLA